MLLYIWCSTFNKKLKTQGKQSIVKRQKNQQNHTWPRYLKYVKYSEVTLLQYVKGYNEKDRLLELADRDF